jgi:RNA polymerase sigma-70 factor, ECF subfamily
METSADIVRRHQKGVWRYLRMLGCDAATADDLTQETFLKVLRRKDFVQHSEAATASYLRRTAHNLMISMLRRAGKVRSTDSLEVLDNTWCRWAGADLSGDESVDALRECLERLTDRAKSALRLRYGEDASRTQIGGMLGITEHGARNLMQRAKQQLRECVDAKLQRNE